MNKLILKYCLALCTTMISMSNNNPQEDNQNRLPIQEQTFLVYRRYYFVARLDKTIQLLAKMYHDVSAMQGMFADKQIVIDEIVPEETYRLFTHKQIRRSVKEIAHTRSLKPLFMVWDSFKSYKSLHDDLLVEDFSKEIFIITRNTIDSLYKHDILHAPKIKFPLFLAERLDALTEMTRILENKVTERSKEIVPHNNNVSGIHLAVHTDEVAFRFYCIHRLRAALNYLLSLPESDQTMNLIGSSFRQFSSRQGLKHLWDDLMQYKYIENEDFIHSFAVYTLMLMHCRGLEPQIYKSISHADLIAMQHRIEQLPLEEILQTIDLIVKQVHNTVNHYHKSGLTFTQWIKRYWWAPTAICTTVAIKCFILYYKNFHRS